MKVISTLLRLHDGQGKPTCRDNPETDSQVYVSNTTNPIVIKPSACIPCYASGQQHWPRKLLDEPINEQTVSWHTLPYVESVASVAKPWLDDARWVCLSQLPCQQPACFWWPHAAARALELAEHGEADFATNPHATSTVPHVSGSLPVKLACRHSAE